MAFRCVIFSVFLVVASAITLDDCPSGLKRDKYLKVFGNSCYRFSPDTTIIYPDAKRICREEGGDLAIVKTKEQNDFIQNEFLNDYNVSNVFIWLGLRYFSDYGEFYWEDGSVPKYTNYENDNPFPSSHECVGMFAVNGKWEVFKCESTFNGASNERARYVCEYPQKSTAVTYLDCPFSNDRNANIKLFNNKCYYIDTTDESPYNVGRRFCTNRGGRYVNIGSAEMKTFLLTMLREIPTLSSSSIWVDREGAAVGSSASCPALNSKTGNVFGVSCGQPVFGVPMPTRHYACEFDVLTS